MQLKQHLRDIFEQEENKIVAASYEDDDEQQARVNDVAGNQGLVDITAKGSNTSKRERNILITQQQSTTRDTDYSGKNRNLKAVSNIHQLYQDLFITDMKDEIAVAGQEVVQLRQELLVRDQQIA